MMCRVIIYPFFNKIFSFVHIKSEFLVENIEMVAIRRTLIMFSMFYRLCIGHALSHAVDSVRLADIFGGLRNGTSIRQSSTFYNFFNL